jgi:hypothetical protein
LSFSLTHTESQKVILEKLGFTIFKNFRIFKAFEKPIISEKFGKEQLRKRNQTEAQKKKRKAAKKNRWKKKPGEDKDYHSEVEVMVSEKSCEETERKGIEGDEKRNQTKKRKRACTKCQQEGHNRRTCTSK